MTILLDRRQVKVLGLLQVRIQTGSTLALVHVHTTTSIKEHWILLSASRPTPAASPVGSRVVFASGERGVLVSLARLLH